jgi:TRAP-type C4-dicarboxylate transport system permease small subunit
MFKVPIVWMCTSLVAILLGILSYNEFKKVEIAESYHNTSSNELIKNVHLVHEDNGYFYLYGCIGFSLLTLISIFFYIKDRKAKK